MKSLRYEIIEVRARAQVYNARVCRPMRASLFTILLPAHTHTHTQLYSSTALCWDCSVKQSGLPIEVLRNRAS